jgi:hypothetical protein
MTQGGSLRAAAILLTAGVRMKVELLADFSTPRGVRESGTVIDVGADEAQRLIKRGLARKPGKPVREAAVGLPLETRA